MKTAEFDRETLRTDRKVTLPGEEVARNIGYFQDGVIEIDGLGTCQYEKIEDGKIRLSYRSASGAAQ